jgi:hypothetical protein
MTDKIIPIGCTCNVSLALSRLGLRGPSSVFEWAVSNKLSEITSLVKNQFKDISAETHNGHQVRIKTTGIFTGHYDLNTYDGLLKRRASRFIDDIKNTSGTIVFLRRDSTESPSTYKEIDDFIKAVLEINPNCKCKMLLIGISKPEQFVPINHELLIHTFIDPQDVPYGEYWDEAGDISIWDKIIKNVSLDFPRYETRYREDKN